MRETPDTLARRVILRPPRAPLPPIPPRRIVTVHDGFDIHQAIAMPANHGATFVGRTATWHARERAAVRKQSPESVSRFKREASASGGAASVRLASYSFENAWDFYRAARDEKSGGTRRRADWRLSSGRIQAARWKRIRAPIIWLEVRLASERHRPSWLLG